MQISICEGSSIGEACQTTTTLNPAPSFPPFLCLFFFFDSPPYRVARTTKSPLPAECTDGGRAEEETETRGYAGSGSGGGGCARGEEGNAEYGATGDDDIDVRGSGAGVSAGGGSERVITAVITLSFVAAPGRTAPDPRAVEYRMDLSSREGSQEVSVFLGEVDYNDAGGGT